MAQPVIKNKYTEHTAIKEIVDDTRVKHSDFVNLKYLYTMCHEWLIENNWGPAKDDSWPERLYMHRWTQKQGEEIWIWWRMRKHMNQFFRCDFDIDWHMVGLKPAEVVHNGKKYKGEKGTTEFKIYVKLIFDPQHGFEKAGWISNLKETFWQRIYYKDFLGFRKQVYHDIYKFKHAIKTYFRLPLYLPEAEGHKFWKDKNMQTPFYEEK